MKIEYRKSLLGTCFFKIIDNRQVLEACVLEGKAKSYRVCVSENKFSLDYATNPMMSTQSTKEEFLEAFKPAHFKIMEVLSETLEA